MFFPSGQKHDKVWGLVLNATTIGLHLVCATFIGLGTGWYLDGWLNTKPWLTLLMLVLGVIAGFKNVFEEMKKIEKLERENRE